MAVYFIVDTMKVTDPQMHAEYSQRAASTLEQYGVKFLVGGSAPHEVIEGIWQTQGVAVLEFEDREHFKRWYDSPEYKEIRRLRIQSTSNRAIVILGK
ncbi:DUF1330 domain-containing protein [Ktedonosporobacter rubrisoli]|uniref:DUF1330 domain-containing protein n=1 Tax=Ktedonosporobacter rubrisoli TaxID=2509675 RepID=A0A4P6JIN8_KTERU|nr:DUF1330 domain-containing protein [Ktedonosporobacter rubrisoli]QBD74947.1 DUF1330 domain-containing protein [Ktedonosporobacter rubrisoli]